LNGLSLVMDGEFYAVDVTTVERVVRNMVWTKVPAAPETVAGIANLKGGIITLLSLARLLGRSEAGQTANAVVFKPFANGDGQMGLLIDRPGDLIAIDDSQIIPPHTEGEMEESSIVSGLAEIEGKLYRIIDIDIILSRFKDSDIKPSNKVSQGGTNSYEED